ncbi:MULTISPECIES: SMP-30/gluconolactonase/LRE family protein [Pseudofrankia]|uniref:SMP-30/gluconolactonase/LRE family protein n=1 Tax=Pseudofrankia TaxID=2994363 RepID=UPI000234D3A6|nr:MULTISPECIES: SMP-30/gluconolactonase/LRE family protein [Pseudofrankia]OHV34862.1 gluconolaconase [Pseudofrankia sp. EUN1h]
MKVLASGLRFPEGPIALDDGSVLVVEIEGGALTRVAADGALSPIHCGGGPNGAALGPDGAVYVCNNGGLAFKTEDQIRFPYWMAEGNEGGYVQRVDLSTGSVEVVFTQVDGTPIGNLNDIVFDEHGSCYIVDTTRGVLYYADPAAGTIRIAMEGLEYPNGMGLSPDGAKLYASETYSGRVLAWDVKAPGSLGATTELYSTGGEHHWDGLAIDGAGNVCASNLEKSGITVISPGGEVLREFVTPEHDPYVTNICFGGPDGDTAFICSAGRGVLYSLQWPWPGLRLNFAR